MAEKANSCIHRLSDGEQASLKILCANPCVREIPANHVDRLLELGFAEVNCGDLGPTGAGRVAMRRIASG